jgi:hypothetical protein
MGPRYAAVCVSAVLDVKPGCSAQAVSDECKRQISAFLHPVCGGDGGSGWACMQLPHRSDLFALLGSVDGVDVVRVLTLDIEPTCPGPFVIAAGNIEVVADG